MTQKKNPNLKLMEPPGPEKPRKKKRRHPRIRLKKLAVPVFLTGMVLLGTYLLITNHLYHKAAQTAAYKRETSDSNRYAAFRNGIIRYGRNGVTFLSRRNEVLWIQPGQFQNPVVDINNQTFAIADSGGNSIQIFTEKGLKGEFETNLPIEKFSLSNQGIVSAILKNENAPMVVTYDSTGNILVENQVVTGSMGYPVALEMSPDGKVLIVSYLDMKNGALKSRVASYNFVEEGADKENHQVGIEEYEDSVMPEIFFMDAVTSVAVGDHSFAISKGSRIPEKKTEINLSGEIRSTFHTSRYIGFILLNEEKSGYELRLYNKSGKQVMNRAISGEFSNVYMEGNEIILYEGSRCSIYTNMGMPRFDGDLKDDILMMVPMEGINQYMMMSTDELRVIYLTG
ncbi:MAG: hypothetical protein HFH16_07110 [Ruminococcus sp.]|uniref:6-bladed beta-propeller n=1 Tax=Schaedlerella arabinosiphila TaxID=2044587 RepID=A0A426DKR3_9FIRM|nr:DUF5711 family protein [Schaedlerella arabinosiphila]MCI8723464.1 hypothetical protein [Ruminococcus sp.]RRK33282.1 hypothetical protein EBB54_19520 [Schaedlerella arabinosiphila]